MTVIRLIYAAVSPEEAAVAEKIWKENCAPLMIAQPGCLAEHLLRCDSEPGEFISYSEWESEEHIKRYLDSDAHREIKRHSGSLKSPRVTVKHYHRVR